MAISDSEKIDLLWKKVGFGVSKTASAAAKAGSNETVASPLAVYAANIWTQTGAEFIPAAVPATDTAILKRYYDAARIQMTNDATSAPNVTWIAGKTDFVPPTFGSGYAVKVYIGNPNGGPAARIYPDTNGEEFTFDYVAGVLNFIGGVPASKAASIGTGTVSVAANGIYIEAYQYVGKKGVAAAGETSKNYVVADIAARDALSGLVAGDIVHVQDASGIPTDASAGEYANYLWTGSAFSLISTQDSARTDALTGSVALTPATEVSTSLGKIGNGSRVVEIVVDVTEAFDGDFDITVGDAGNATRLLDGSAVDLQGVGTYVVTPTYRFPADAETELLMAVTGTATVGAATVTFTYA